MQLFKPNYIRREEYQYNIYDLSKHKLYRVSNWINLS